jgi:hypothetical protein
MSKFHKVTINGTVHYRAFDSLTGYYDNEMLKEEDLIEQLLEEVVESEIEIDEDEIERAINYIPRPCQRDMVQNYIIYLQAVIESFQ